jgi:hypothetical protein
MGTASVCYAPAAAWLAFLGAIVGGILGVLIAGVVNTIVTHWTDDDE